VIGSRLFIFSCFLLLAAPQLFAAETATALKTQNEKESYSIGYQVGISMKTDGVEVDFDKLVQGLQDAINAKEPLLSTEEMRTLIVDFKKGARESGESPPLFDLNQTSNQESYMKKSIVVALVLSLALAGPVLTPGLMAGGQQVAPAVAKPMTLAITGKIVKGDQGYVIQGQRSRELFTVLNPNPIVLDKLVKSGDTVTIEVVSVMGDNVNIQKIDGKPYKEAEEK